jgi:hypothetical protein
MKGDNKIHNATFAKNYHLVIIPAPGVLRNSGYRRLAGVTMDFGRALQYNNQHILRTEPDGAAR